MFFLAVFNLNIPRTDSNVTMNANIWYYRLNLLKVLFMFRLTTMKIWSTKLQPRALLNNKMPHVCSPKSIKSHLNQGDLAVSAPSKHKNWV